MAKRGSSNKSALHQTVPHWVAYVLLGTLFLMAIKLVKIVAGYGNFYW